MDIFLLKIKLYYVIIYLLIGTIPAWSKQGINPDLVPIRKTIYVDEIELNYVWREGSNVSEFLNDPSLTCTQVIFWNLEGRSGELKRRARGYGTVPLVTKQDIVLRKESKEFDRLPIDFYKGYWRFYISDPEGGEMIIVISPMLSIWHSTYDREVENRNRIDNPPVDMIWNSILPKVEKDEM